MKDAVIVSQFPHFPLLDWAGPLQPWYLLDSVVKSIGTRIQTAFAETLPELIVNHMDFDHPKLSEKYAPKNCAKPIEKPSCWGCHSSGLLCSDSLSNSMLPKSSLSTRGG